MRKQMAILIVSLACGIASPGRAQEPAAAPPPAGSTAVADSAVQAAAPESAVAAAPADSVPSLLPQKHFIRAAGEVFAVNALIWSFDRYIREGGTNTGFRIGFKSWHENLTNGFEWDDNQFATNQFAHPYHGSTYFSAARSNGYDYYESIPFAFAGSAMWEYFAETHHPSINDWINTSVGGVALGEALHQLAGRVRDQKAQGSERFWREFGGILIDPMGGFNRLLTGELTQVGANPPGWRERKFTAAVRVGARLTGEQSLSTADTIRAFIRLRGVVGDPAGSVVRKPFEVMAVDIQFNADDQSAIGRAQMVGILRSWETGRTEKSSTYFAITNTWDYINTFAYEYGGPAFGAGFFAKMKSDDGWVMNAGLTGNWIVLGGTTSDYESYTGRSYDYGPGFGAGLIATLRKGRTMLALESTVNWLRIMNGTDANHILAENRLTASIPVHKSFNIGAEYDIYNAERRYANYPDVSRRNPQLTAYLSYITF